ncbi:unnamed protein product [Mytilus coruscus]|uniref:Uncharacterized protein n=1 Tax=Mytilus coruscus TaxID=42192 RepID=A0A6J8ASS2_MYTCO|nr:unnamed protein product [Mytilus coruscus]
MEYNKRISGDEYLYKTVSGVTKISCAYKCSVEKNCCVANFDANSQTCYLDMSGGCYSAPRHENSWITIRRAREDSFNWGPWSKCSKTCEGGIRTRSHLHANVAGNVTSVEGCHNFGCNDIALNCNGWKTKGLLDSQTALIEPMASNGIQLQAVHIYCDMEMENGVGVTVIGNQKWNTYWTNRSTAYLAINEYKPPSVFFHGSEERRICDCGISQTCHRSDVLCNCDINDGIWRSDEGYVTNKDALPIVAFFAGDTGSAQEEGKHFIGPIECYGDA